MRLTRALHDRGRFRVEFVDLTDAGALSATFERKPAVCRVETPSNPLLTITDLTAFRHLCAGDRLMVVDNTFLSPALQRPITAGADMVVHSTTKYLNGHSDSVGGAVIAADAAVHEQLHWWANCPGLPGSPFAGFLTQRELRSLHARIAVHERNARAVVEALRRHPVVGRVFHPGPPFHPGHDIAARQQNGYGAIVSFELVGGIQSVRTLLDGLRHFSLAESLGGLESLVAHPVTMTHAAMDPEARARAGITDALLRLSVGIEDEKDLVADVTSGLDRAEQQLASRPSRANAPPG